MTAARILARANINLRGLKAGQVGWVDPTDATIKMYIECDYLTAVPMPLHMSGGADAETKVPVESGSEHESLLGAGYPDGTPAEAGEGAQHHSKGV